MATARETVTAATKSQHREQARIYRPKEGVHLTQLGVVALSNWIGAHEGQSVRVYRGASIKELPESLQKRMLEDGIEFGKITMADLGLAPKNPNAPVRGRGAVVLPSEV